MEVRDAKDTPTVAGQDDVAAHDDDRVIAVGRQLAGVHDLLRRRVRRIRDGLPNSAPELREHCLAFCAALGRHHRGEDDGMFTALRHARPDLSGTIDKLVEDHWLIAGILTRVEELARADAPSVGELDGLMAIMESHFRFEERVLADVVLPADAWTGPVLDPFDTADDHLPHQQ
jgi:hypothetical protein